MILLEVFKKRRLYEPILQKTWDRISTDIPYPQVVEEEPAQKLVYFGIVAYATVFESAMAAGMSPSAGHYLARMQIGEYKLDKLITQAVESIFSGFDAEEEQAYADFFLTRLAQVIKMISVEQGDVAPVMQELAQGFKNVTFKNS